jgi:hypothetical protein
MTALHLHPVRNTSARASIPNNLGPTLLLSFGFLLLPVVVGVPLLVVGLARIRDARGQLALPWLSLRLSSLQVRLRLPS